MRHTQASMCDFPLCQMHLTVFSCFEFQFTHPKSFSVFRNSLDKQEFDFVSNFQILLKIISIY